MPSKSSPVRTWLIVSQVIYVLSLLPWIAMSALAVMAFDAPGSERQVGPWIFAGSIWAYPILPLVSAIVAWVLYARGRTRGAAIATAVPIIVVLAAGMAFGLMVLLG